MTYERKPAANPPQQCNSAIFWHRNTLGRNTLLNQCIARHVVSCGRSAIAAYSWNYNQKPSENCYIFTFSTVLSGLIYIDTVYRYSNLTVIRFVIIATDFKDLWVTLYPSIRPGWPSSLQAATSSIRRMMKWWQSWTKAIAISLVLNWNLHGFKFNCGNCRLRYI